MPRYIATKYLKKNSQKKNKNFYFYSVNKCIKKIARILEEWHNELKNNLLKIK